MRPGGEAGFSLLEVVAGMAFATVSLLALGAAYLASQHSYETAAEEAAATHTFRLVAERIRGAPFEEIPASYQGFTFTVGEIGATGRVTIFLDEADSSPEAQLLGLPRDLNGDGYALTRDISPRFELLPVRIELAWMNFQGPQVRSHHFLLSRER